MRFRLQSAVAAFCALLLAAAPALAGTLSSYPLAGTLTGPETLIGTQNGTTVNVTIEDIASFITSPAAGAHFADLPSPIYIGTNTPSSNLGSIQIGRTITGGANTFIDGVRDDSVVAYTGSEGGYASFDSLVTETGNVAQNHLNGYQDRDDDALTAALGSLEGFTFSPSVSGGGSVGLAIGLDVYDAVLTNGSSIADQYAIYIRPQTAGASNLAIFSQSTAPSIIDGTLILAATSGDPALEVTGSATFSGQVTASALASSGGLSSFPSGGSAVLVGNGTGNAVLEAFSDGGATYKSIEVNPTAAYGSGALLIGLSTGVGNSLLQVGTPIQTTKTYTIASGANKIPTCDAADEGAHDQVSDGAASPVFGAIQAGGGSTWLPVTCNGTNWING